MTETTVGHTAQELNERSMARLWSNYTDVKAERDHLRALHEELVEALRALMACETQPAYVANDLDAEPDIDYRDDGMTDDEWRRWRSTADAVLRARDLLARAEEGDTRG